VRLAESIPLFRFNLQVYIAVCTEIDQFIRQGNFPVAGAEARFMFTDFIIDLKAQCAVARMFLNIRPEKFRCFKIKLK
jgi:hypothetical protein